MRPDKRYLIASLLIGVLALPGTLLCFYRLNQYIIRNEMAEKIELEQQQTITLSASSVHWYEEGREIIVDGKLFDVDKFATKGDSLVFTGLFDEKETALKKQIETLQQQQQKEEEKRLLTKLLSLEICKIDEKSPGYFEGFNCFKTLYPPLPEQGLLSVYLPLTFPPPKLTN